MRKLFKSFWFNLLLIIGICFLLYFAFFASLSRITNHGNELRVPEIEGKNVTEALSQLQKMGFDVVIDSAYDTLSTPMVILEVQPEAGSMVKAGRSIFITVNKSNPPEVDMPNLLNLSLRSAHLMLQSNKLVSGDTIFKPDMAEGAVLEQLFNGKPISSGQKIFQGSKIDLVIGSGYSQSSMIVPDLINLTYYDAKRILDSANLFITEVWDGRISDSTTAVVYFQMPPQKNEQGYPNSILEGENVDIRIRQQPLMPDTTTLVE